MRIRGLFRTLVVFSICLFAFSAWAQHEASRFASFHADWPETLELDINIIVSGEAGAFTVSETPPVGWEVSRILSSGDYVDGVISWESSIRRAGLNKTLTYTLTLPSLDAAVGVFEGYVNDVKIGGFQIFTPGKVNPDIQTPIKSGLNYNYLVYLPPSYEIQDEPMPLMFFLHGAGERGSNMELVKVHGPPKIVENPSMKKSLFGDAEFPFILVSPQCPAGGWWENEPLLKVVNEVLENYAVDLSKIYITGVSMGGFGSWSFASEHPELIAAALPIAGGGDVFNWSIKSYASNVDNLKAADANNLVDIPVWAFHGDSDTVVPIELDQEIVDQITELGGDVQFKVYPGAGHVDSWTQTYNNPDIYPWLLSKQKGSTDSYINNWSMFK